MKWQDDIDENLRCGIVELLILELLSEQSMYGYQIRQELAKRTQDIFTVKEGSLYVPLYRMNERKLISSEKIVVGEKRFRNYYHIEESGKEYLAYGKEQLALVFNGADMMMHFTKTRKKSKASI